MTIAGSQSTSALAAAPSHLARLLMSTSIALAMLGNHYVYDSIGPVAESLSHDLHFSDTISARSTPSIVCRTSSWL